MDDVELVFSSANIGDEIPSSGTMGSYIDEILNGNTSTCNHLQTTGGSSEEKSGYKYNDDSSDCEEQKTLKKGGNNREAVRKYRQKKKANAALLENEVLKLSALNEQLLKRLERQSVLEAEIARLKCLLVDIRGRIEGEIASFPYQKNHYQP
ncbi:hypothetical protein SOVF_172820 [Spinacia oleracea]|uniref:Basic leucine zipper 23 n=1 Tax=Spinacia oleracea TaxID=3562 RepID=A0A9R0JEQ4_SPIOL|nr:basic leucine zipper 23-like [Spinacia oleracea]XP_021866468.1 basic leucine zipper 23-like [Spinacia oleracea]XP_056687106.1 basic leucine zipper 23-like [Spinacia oleracea]KNA07344.1 hypothetical protein SOVF_172820 [Spinacia oleracea]